MMNNTSSFQYYIIIPYLCKQFPGRLNLDTSVQCLTLKFISVTMINQVHSSYMAVGEHHAETTAKATNYYISCISYYSY